MLIVSRTGATGYIGGDALYVIAAAHPEYEITCLVRNSDKGAQVANAYPKAKLVYGDLDSFDLIAEQSALADIVCHFANCDHEGSATAIIKGLSSRSTPGYIIHTSGTGILTVGDVQANRYGVEDSKIYDDWDNVDEVTSLPDNAWHRNVDKIILAASKSAPNIKTAIVCPPTISGPGRGPGNTFSDQWYFMCKAFIQRGYAFTIGQGKNVWTKVHVHDLSKLYLTLIEEAGKCSGREKFTRSLFWIQLQVVVRRPGTIRATTSPKLESLFG
jgi:nucleoside-diphosphate-sugar epimerase